MHFKAVLVFTLLSILTNVTMAKQAIASYDLKTFDVSISKLPVGYNGHNIKKIITELYKRKNAKKDQYETTKDFQNRIARKNNQPIYGKVLSTGYQTYVTQLDQEYDADKGTLVLSTGIDDKDELLAAFTNENSPTRVFCEFYNLKTDIMSNSAFNKYISKGKFSLSMKSIPPNKAKKYKGKIDILYVLRVTNPSDVDGSGQHWKTGIQETTTNSFSLPVNVSQIWVFNKSTGEIFYKFK